MESARGMRPCRGHHEGGERPFGIDRAAAVELAIVDADGDVARNGVDVPEEYDLGTAFPDTPDGVARLVYVRLHPQPLHRSHKVVDSSSLVARNARDLDQPAQQFDRGASSDDLRDGAR